MHQFQTPPTQRFARPYFLLVEPDVVDGRIRGNCSFHIFKKPAAVPRAMYERVGLAPA